MSSETPAPAGTTGGAPAAAAAAASSAKPILLIAGIVGLLVVGAVAAAAVLLPRTTQPQDVLPDNTLALAVVDLDPSLGQKVNLVRLLSSLPESEGVSTEVNSDDPIGSLITDPKAKAQWDQISPWLGDKIALALLPNRDGDLAPMLAVQVSNEEEAKAWLDSESDSLLSDAISGTGLSVEESDKVEFAFRDGYALISTDSYVVERAASTDRVLADNEEFASDRDALGDQIVWGWIDAGETVPLVRASLEEAWAESAVGSDIDSLDGVQGRLLFGIAAQPSDIETTLMSRGASIGALDDFGDLQFTGTSPLAESVPAGSVMGLGSGGFSVSLSSVADDLGGLSESFSSADFEKLAATPISLYLKNTGESENFTFLARFPTDSADLVTRFLDEVGVGSEYGTLADGDHTWAVLSTDVPTEDEMRSLIAPGGAAGDLARSIPAGGLTGFTDLAGIGDAVPLLNEWAWKENSTTTLSLSTGPDRGDAKIIQRYSFGAIIGAAESASGGGALQQNAAASSLTTTAEAIVRNTNAIAVSSLAGAGDATQDDLELALSESLGDPPSPEYSFSNLGSGDAPSVTITYARDGLTCSVTVAKVLPTDGLVAVTAPAVCS